MWLLFVIMVVLFIVWVAYRFRVYMRRKELERFVRDQGTVKKYKMSSDSVSWLHILSSYGFTKDVFEKVGDAYRNRLCYLNFTDMEYNSIVEYLRNGLRSDGNREWNRKTEKLVLELESNYRTTQPIASYGNL